MKIKIQFTINVDPEAWANEYGIDLDDVREDVKRYIENHSREQVEFLGLAEEITHS